MPIQFISPKKAVNSAYLKLPISYEKMDIFKACIKSMADLGKAGETEEYHKGLINKFLSNALYNPDYAVNTKDRIDLAIFNGKDNNAKAAVLIEVKAPENAAEMFSESHSNVKSLQELVYYFMKEYIRLENHEIKYLAITNYNDWYFFDAKDFVKFFAAKSNPVYSKFLKFDADQMSDSKTSFFYSDIARPAIDKFIETCELSVVHFSLAEAVKAVEKNDEKKLFALYKFLSPETLLSKPFANDSNSLDKNFYAELLHIIGLEEVKEDGKKVIRRKKPENRDKASLLESAIYQLQIDEPNADKREEIALRLCITWINRLLFLKLVESQILMYQKGNADYKFMSLDKIKSFDELNIFFFMVLGKKIDERDEDIKAKYPNVPYLNSSLFEPTDDEGKLKIRGIPDEQIEIYNKTVLKDEKGKRAKGTLLNLDYIFKFLDAYNFASDAQGGVTSTNKTLINASVLGLIFEKINGYKDGSFYTPGFITDYMARDVLERTVVQKFNEKKSWKCENLEDVSDKIEDISEANEIVDDIRVADVAVGSGHFLVSALNRLLAIKSELNILCDTDGKRIKRRDLILKVDNDELSVVDDEGEPFEYKPGNEESQRYQEALFNEKRRIIENCLFGVDLNPNSVNICRLRLWIELLKNAYYTKESGYTRLQTLPNIDINIKVGDSLLSQYPVQNGRLVAEYLSAEEKSDRKKDSLKNNLAEYRQCVQDYKSGKTQNSKLSLRQKIAGLKSRIVESGTIDLFDGNASSSEGVIDFSNSMEWMFEFPEILDDEGKFVGFDVIIGNPPYIHLEEMKDMSKVYGAMGGEGNKVYSTYNKRGDIYCLFVERAVSLLRKNGFASYIMQNKWMQASYGKELREFFLNTKLEKLIDFGDIQVFDDATTYPCIFLAQKAEPKSSFVASTLKTLERTNFEKSVNQYAETFERSQFTNDAWTISSQSENKLLLRLEKEMTTLGKYVNGDAHYGIKPGNTKAFIIDEKKKDELISLDANSAKIIAPIVRGRNLKVYESPDKEELQYLILASFGSYKYLESEYPAVYKWLFEFKEDLQKRGQCNGSKMREDKPFTGSHHWLELDNCPTAEYLALFAKPKIMYQKFQVKPCFVYDEQGLYCNDSMWIIPTEDKALLALLNSKMGWWLMKKKCTQIQNGVQLIWQYLSKIPVPRELPQELATLADQIITAKKSGEPTTALETQVNEIVYQLYGVTEQDEINTVERG